MAEAEDRIMGCSRLFDAMQELGPTLGKTAKNPHFDSGYVPLPALMLAVRPVLEKHGLLLVQGTCQAPYELQIAVKTVIIDVATGTEVVGGLTILPVPDRNPQKATAAITYARRTGITTLLGIAEADDDGNAAARTEKKGGPKVADEPNPDNPFNFGE